MRMVDPLVGWDCEGFVELVPGLTEHLLHVSSILRVTLIDVDECGY